MVKVDVFSGFLGAGKTTLIKRLIEESYKGEQVVLIENEFGEIGVDGGFLRDAGFEIREINSGCICCTLVGDFTKALGEVVKTYNPTRIIIEPSGVGKLSDIKDIIINAGLEINMLVAVVDALKGKIYMKNFGEFFNNQISEATTILISKTDKAPEQKVLELVELIKEKNPYANIITTSIFDLDVSTIVKVFEHDKSMLDEMIEEMHHEKCHDHDEECHCHEHDEECHCHDHDEECHCHERDEECHCHEHDEECHCHEHDEECHCHEHDEECHCHEGHHHADEIFDNYGLEAPISYTKDELTNILKALQNDDTYGYILRAKGIVKASDNEKWYYFDLASDEYEIRLGRADYTSRLCVIGSDLNKTRLAKLLKKQG